MTALYKTRVTANGGRNGTVASEDGLLDLTLAPPKELGGKGGATNPEQLFAAGYAACFASALAHVAQTRKVRLDGHAIQVKAEIGLNTNPDGSFCLSAALQVDVTGIEPSTAEELIREADRVCPYSNAIRKNVAVSLIANGSELRA